MRPVLSEQQVIRQYQDAGFLRGNELYLEPKVALDFVATCEANELAVVGVEGFTLRNERLIPRMDLIADWSSASAAKWDEYRRKCNQLSAAFVDRYQNEMDLVMNLTVLSKTEWQHREPAP